MVRWNSQLAITLGLFQHQELIFNPPIFLNIIFQGLLVSSRKKKILKHGKSRENKFFYLSFCFCFVPLIYNCQSKCMIHAHALSQIVCLDWINSCTFFQILSCHPPHFEIFILKLINDAYHQCHRTASIPKKFWTFLFWIHSFQ